MNGYTYEAVDSAGLAVKGILDVASQSQALRRIREMGLFPTLVKKRRRRRFKPLDPSRAINLQREQPTFAVRPRIKARTLTLFTRQLATLLQAGMPLLRGLRILEEQERNKRFRSEIYNVSKAIEGGDSLSQAFASRPKVFNQLYVNLVRAGEVSGALDAVLLRLAGFQEKTQRTKGKVVAAMFYPSAVLLVAISIMTLLMVFVVPRFKQVFEGLLGGAQLPAFSLLVFGVSDVICHHALEIAVGALALGTTITLLVRTTVGRRVFDALKLKLPVVGDVVRKAAIARLTRTLATLLGSGVPVLQALSIVKETAGNVLISAVIASVHECVKQGDPIAPALRNSGVFPAMVSGMVDVGEQTGALPDMLSKTAEIYDEEVDNAINAMTSLLEPMMIILLALMVGSIVIALFLPIITATDGI